MLHRIDTSADPASDYQLLGEGECRQADGQYALQLRITFSLLNKDQAREPCLKLCKKYSWCYAVVLSSRDISTSPTSCDLVTDRPTYENAYGSGQNYDWGTLTTIECRLWQVLCGGGSCENNEASNWNGGSLRPRTGYFCYKKLGRRKISFFES